jgi:hypothetical protein
LEEKRKSRGIKKDRKKERKDVENEDSSADDFEFQYDKDTYNNELWIEKYKPHKFSELITNDVCFHYV